MARERFGRDGAERVGREATLEGMLGALAARVPEGVGLAVLVDDYDAAVLRDAQVFYPPFFFPKR